MVKTLLTKLKQVFSKKKPAQPLPFSEISRKKAIDNEKKRAASRPKPKEQQKAPQPPAKAPQPPTETKKQVPQKKREPVWSLDDFQVDPLEGSTRFHDLNLPVKLMRAIHKLDYKYCTPIQAETLPHTLNNRDAIAQAQTGTGKTAAFLITIIARLVKQPVKGGPPKQFPRALILAPTRELALQIEKDAFNLTQFTPFNVISVFGGMGYEKQQSDLKNKSFDIVVATPGRLIDYLNKKVINLSKIEVLVIDEADRMLDMGFIPDIRKIVYKTPDKTKRQTLFYSATYTDDVSRLAHQWTKNALVITAEADHIAADTINQKIFLVTANEKYTVLYNIITKLGPEEKILIFTNRRDQTRKLSDRLNAHNFKTEVLSGDVHQSKRMKSLEKFKNGTTRIMVATDVAARGIHIDDISYVINYNIPNEPDHYVHRIGRTGRAGTSGISVSFACEDESFYIPAIEEVINHKLICEHPDEALLKAPPKPTFRKKPAQTVPGKPAHKKNLRPNKRYEKKYQKKQ